MKKNMKSPPSAEDPQSKHNLETDQILISLQQQPAENDDNDDEIQI